jgi:hypothetical protein
MDKNARKGFLTQRGRQSSLGVSRRNTETEAADGQTTSRYQNSLKQDSTLEDARIPEQ